MIDDSTRQATSSRVQFIAQLATGATGLGILAACSGGASLIAPSVPRTEARTLSFRRFAPVFVGKGYDLHRLISSEPNGSYDCTLYDAGNTVTAVDAAGNHCGSAKVSVLPSRQYQFALSANGSQLGITTASFDSLRVGTNSFSPGVSVDVATDGSASSLVGAIALQGTVLSNGDVAVSAISQKDGNGVVFVVPYSQISPAGAGTLQTDVRHTMDCASAGKVAMAGATVGGAGAIIAAAGGLTADPPMAALGLAVAGVGGVLAVAGGIAWFIQGCK